ncbi:MAG: AI-2E family transporter [Candidatus Liptonbacteria bacterium]|nr:AI-2E family transporter [Candidatus Liptonbacteria bacterium]
MSQENSLFSTEMVMKFALAAVVLALAYYLREILLLVFAAGVFAMAIDKPIDALEARRLPRWLATFLIYGAIFLIFLGALALILPPLGIEVANIAVTYAPRIRDFFGEGGGASALLPVSFTLAGLIQNLSGAISGGAERAVQIFFALFGGTASFIVLLSLAFFLNLQDRGVRRFVHALTPRARQVEALELFGRIEAKVSAWLWGRIVISAIVGVLIFLGLYLIGVPYAFTLGVLSSVLNFIPFIGPVIAAIPAIFLAASQSLFAVVGTLIIFFVVNQVIEGFVLTPLLMKRALDLNPFLLLVALLIGGQLAGLLGVIIALPAAAIVFVLVEEYLRSRG